MSQTARSWSPNLGDDSKMATKSAQTPAWAQVVTLELTLTRRAMEVVLFNLHPRSRCTPRLLLLLPNEHLSVIRTRRQYVSVLWMRPCNLPDWASMPTHKATSVARAVKVPNQSSTYPFKTWPPPAFCGSPSTTSNTFTVRSDEQVARRFP